MRKKKTHKDARLKKKKGIKLETDLYLLSPSGSSRHKWQKRFELPARWGT